EKFATAGVVVLEKQVYDLFSNPNSDLVISAAREAEFVVYGVATDYCVRAAVLGLLDRGRRGSVVGDAIRPVDAQLGIAAIKDFQERGARLVTTDQACSMTAP